MKLYTVTITETICYSKTYTEDGLRRLGFRPEDTDQTMSELMAEFDGDDSAQPGRNNLEEDLQSEGDVQGSTWEVEQKDVRITRRGKTGTFEDLEAKTV